MWIKQPTLGMNILPRHQMLREDVKELNYIAPLDNVDSILKLGILSHRQAQAVEHRSVALSSVQEIRSKVWLPNVKSLHSHVNLYFDARNPMMYYLHEQHQELVVIEVSPDVLDIPGAFITDGNAAYASAKSRRTSFYKPDENGFSHLDKDLIYADSWTDPDPLKYSLKKSRKCAEVLIPNVVPPNFISRISCSCDVTNDKLSELRYNIETRVVEHMFFT